ncbi:transcriptional regulator GlxA family with amidase domain [Luteibacter sp. HA06]
MREATRACGVSREHFSRAFKIATGITPSRWHLEKRLDRAKHLIAENELSLAAIAVDCGFTDQSHLTNAFKRLRHESPGKYRRSLAD